MLQKVELIAPPTCKAVTIRIKLTPSTGALLVYGAPDYNKAIKFHGPQQIGSVSTRGQFVQIEPVDGATAWEIETLGWTDDLSS